MSLIKTLWNFKPIFRHCQVHSVLSNFRNFIVSPTLGCFGHGPKHFYSVVFAKQIEPSTLDTEFLSVFPKLVEDLTTGQDSYLPSNSHLEKTHRWFSRVQEYNVPLGKRTRGLSVALAYRYSAKHPTKEGIYLSYVLGWCLEMLQAYILVVDDIMDNSKMRRGRPSWHQVEGIGNLAMNDACYIYSAIFVLLKKYFEHKPFYVPLLELVHDVNHKTIYGQCLDTRTSLEKKFETYNMELYSTILKYKAGFYVAYLPVKLGLMLAGVANESAADQKLRDIMFEIGELYQFQNDFNDCFGAADAMGKPGNDIQNGKCTWNFITARQKCSPIQKTVLLENYGKDDIKKAKIVKNLYSHLQIPQDYKVYMKNSHERIFQKVEKLSMEFPSELFQDVMRVTQIEM